MFGKTKVKAYGCTQKGLFLPPLTTATIPCLKKDEALWLIILYVELDLIHHTRNSKRTKEIWVKFHKILGIVNTTQVNRLETEISKFQTSKWVPSTAMMSILKGSKMCRLISSFLAARQTHNIIKYKTIHSSNILQQNILN